MNTTRILTLVGTSCLLAFATAPPAFADTKPCCYNSGQYFQSSPSTCQKNGGRTVAQDYCQRYGGQNGYGQDGYYGQEGYYGQDDHYRPNDYYRGNPGAAAFSIILGNVVLGYYDGYYDNNRRWHGWRNDRERAWYQQNRRSSYQNIRRNRDRDRNRRDWREGRRDRWN
jgi:hypothetical protein